MEVSDFDINSFLKIFENARSGMLELHVSKYA